MADDPIKGDPEDGKTDAQRAHGRHFSAASSTESQGEDDNDVRGHQETSEAQMTTQAEKNIDTDVEGPPKRRV